MKAKVIADVDSKTEEKQRLIDALDLVDIRTKAEQLDVEIKTAWEKTGVNWQIASQEYGGYTNFLGQEIASSRKLNQQYKERVQALQQEINKFEIKEGDLVRERQKLEIQGYDALSLFYPERIVEDLINNKNIWEQEIVRLQTSISDYQEQAQHLSIDIKHLEYQQVEQGKHIEALKVKAKKQEKYEY